MGLGSNQNATPLLHSLQVTQSVYGIAIPIGAGCSRAPGNLLWWGDFNTGGKAYNLGGSGLGKSDQYDYAVSMLAALCHGPVAGIGAVWGQNGSLTIQNATEPYTVPPGGGIYTVLYSALYSADQGVGALTPYSVTANDYGSPGPVTLTGTTIASVPLGSGGYTIPTPGQYAFAASMAGQQVQISYSYSMYTVSASEDYNIPNTGPYEITVENQTTFYADGGVSFVDTGIPLSPVSGTPTLTGTYNPNRGNYLFAAVDELRPVVINYSWQQSNSNLNPGAIFSFTLLNGAQGQSPWSYLTSKHLSQALGYSTIACIAAENMDLGPSGQMENYNYEILGPFQFGAGIVDADCATWILNFLQNLLWGCQFPGNVDDSLTDIARDYWNANGFFVSPWLDSARAAADYITDWCEAGNVGVYWSDNCLKFIPYGDTTQVGNGYTFSPLTAPVVDLNDTDFIVDGDEDPVEISRTPWQDAYNEVKVQFTNRDNNYNDDSVVLQDDNAVALFGLRPEGQKSYGFLKTIPAANFAANIRLKRLVNIRKNYTFKVSGIRYCFLEPMDLVTLTDLVTGLSLTPVRITEISEDANRVYTVKAEEFPWGTATATLYPKQPAMLPPPLPSMADPGNTVPLDLFEPPAAIAQTVANSAYQIWLALTGGSNWGGCLVMFSTDGTSYGLLPGKQTGTSRGGALTAALPQVADPDSTSTLAVQTTGQLFNVTLAQVNAFVTLSKVGQEYLAYQNATLTGSDSQTNSYTLNYLRRGAFSTPDLAHIIGEPFVRIDSQLFQYSYNPSLVGTLVYFKFLSYNLLGQMQQGLSDVPAFPYLVGGSNASQNMALQPIDSGGWEINIFRQGGAVGTAGTATLTNGATIPLPASTITGLSASTTYWVSYDLGTAAYVSFTTQAAYLAALALGASIGIGSCSTSAGGTVYYPSYALYNPAYMAVANSSNIWDGDPSTYATVTELGTSNGDQGGAAINFPNFVTTAPMTLSFTVAIPVFNSPSWQYIEFAGVINNAQTTFATLHSTLAKTTYTLSIPIGTNLNTVAASWEMPLQGTDVVYIYDVNIQ